MGAQTNGETGGTEKASADRLASAECRGADSAFSTRTTATAPCYPQPSAAIKTSAALRIDERPSLKTLLQQSRKSGPPAAV